MKILYLNRLNKEIDSLYDELVQLRSKILLSKDTEKLDRIEEDLIELKNILGELK